jgi:hypothetical protein
MGPAMKGEEHGDAVIFKQAISTIVATGDLHLGFWCPLARMEPVAVCVGGETLE